VDWYIDGAPQVTVFWGGKEWEPLGSASGSARISIESCHVCKDTMSSDPSAQKPRQVGLESNTSGAPGECDAFLQKMLHITNDLSNDTDGMLRAMDSLCGGADACMKKIQRCAEM
jgi:hypothetical protein